MEPYQALALTGSAIAIIVSLFTFFKTRRVTLYQDLDRLYLEVLKLAIEYPRFVDPQLTEDYKRSFKDEERLRYEAYAFIVWNICETIADRRKETPLFRTNETALFRTWEPVLKAENGRHRTWFDSEENSDKFKSDFRAFIQNRYPRSQRAVRASPNSDLAELEQ